MSTKPRLFDVVALVEDVAGEGLVVGQVGTVVEIVDDVTLLVEFSDEEGKTYAVAAMSSAKLLVLRYTPVAA